MTPTEQALARELAQHPAWVWMDGMLAQPPWNWVGWPPKRMCADWRRHAAPEPPPRGYALDLADSATQGCLIAALGERLLRVEQIQVGLSTSPECRYEWEVEVWHETARTYDTWRCTTLGEALARAWLAVNRSGA